VKFLSRGSGYGLYLTPTETVLTLKKPSDLPPLPTNEAPSLSPLPAGEGRGEGNNTSATVRMKLVGANRSPKMAGEAALPGKVNYLIGKDPSKWRTNVPTFGKVRYEAVYPGIDLVYYGNQRQMEYDFVVAPGADPNQILLSFAGLIPSPSPSPRPSPRGRGGSAEDGSVRIADDGDLVLATHGGDVRMKKPVIYQEIAGVRVPVSGGYRLLPLSPPHSPSSILNSQFSDAVSFHIAAYDRTRPLIIDPILVYSTYLGGASHEGGAGIAVDATGAAYVTGSTNSTDFPTASPLQGALAEGEESMTQEQNNLIRTLVFMIIFVPVIGWLIFFSIKKNNESGQRSQMCQEECTKSGHMGYEFKWNILSGPVCQCIQ
jgi:hypothetical protein